MAEVSRLYLITFEDTDGNGQEFLLEETEAEGLLDSLRLSLEIPARTEKKK